MSCSADLRANHIAFARCHVEKVKPLVYSHCCLLVMYMSVYSYPDSVCDTSPGHKWWCSEYSRH